MVRSHVAMRPNQCGASLSPGVHLAKRRSANGFNAQNPRVTCQMIQIPLYWRDISSLFCMEWQSNGRAALLLVQCVAWSKWPCGPGPNSARKINFSAAVVAEVAPNEVPADSLRSSAALSSSVFSLRGVVHPYFPCALACHNSPLGTSDNEAHLN